MVTATADHKFRYDALGRRVGKWDGSAWQDLVVSGQQLLMVYSTNGVAKHRYVYGSYVDEPVVVEKNLSTTPAKYFHHRNQQYSVIALTNESGLTVERYTYDAYGKTVIYTGGGGTVVSATRFSNPFQYTGRYNHEDVGLYFFRARWYSPSLGRFISRDPLGYVDGMSYV